MELILFMLITLLFPATATIVFYYLRSSFALLELVKRDNALWIRLDRPEKIWVREQGGGFATIKPLLPWLSWLWAGNTNGLNPDLTRQAATTRKLLKTGLMLFLLTCAAIIALVASAP